MHTKHTVQTSHHHIDVMSAELPGLHVHYHSFLQCDSAMKIMMRCMRQMSVVWRCQTLNACQRPLART